MTTPFRSRHRAGRRAARRDGQRRPGPRWGLRIGTGASVLLLSASGVGHAMVTGVESGIGRVDAFTGMSNRPGGGKGLNFLVVGTDGRDRLTEEEKRRYHLGGQPCHCTDTLMLVHLSADRDRASVISLPRDSYAEVPAHVDPVTGRPRDRRAMKLNAAYAEGGPSLTVRTVEHMTGVHIDHYLEVDFTSFMRSVDAVGGVEICTSRPLRDSYTGLDLPAGKSRLNGGQALQYVRSRHLDGSADLGRMQRQQRFLAALIDKVASSGVLMNPIRVKDVAGAMLESVRADSGFTANDLVDLGQAMRGFTASSSEFTSVPLASLEQPVPGVGSTVRWDPVAAPKLFQAIREDRPIAVRRDRPEPRATAVEVAPDRIQVRVADGSGRAGPAAAVARDLRATGFAIVGTPGDSATGRAPHTPHTPHTVIAYDPRWNRSARSLAAALPGAQLRPVAGQGPVLRVTVGRDHTEVRRVRAEEPAREPGGIAAITGDEAVCP
ncbi:putative LytR family transcriptional regulator [Streptomyces sp. NBRC 110611]|uniref:LCP family protein n=1 Tax=Streptomyces sp. NBRC 110611 TaxID=1621259 RepID=UPI000837401E|nr:LCP family protein [Streptomyces sp. NBRC 110611]GAU68543.1 putative LytR family transcriptional regulator [Streptomyces sp. NBRC 110611]